MVALALDIGETRIGIAVSSRDGMMAMPVKVLPAAEVTGMAKTFRYLVEDYEPDILVSGRPLTMAGRACCRRGAKDCRQARSSTGV